jgi:hypothetical protein
MVSRGYRSRGGVSEMMVFKVADSGNDEFYTPRYAIDPLLKYVSPDCSVWCPFDTDESLIVRALRERGNRVTATHISTGTDFFSASVPDCDVVISNPPYSRKSEVFERLFDMNKPFAMLVGVVGLFEARRFHIFKDRQFEIMWLSGRVAYFKSFDEERPSVNPAFSSVWVTSGILPQANVFETITKKQAAA